MSLMKTRLEIARERAWDELKPAYDHAIALAKEADYQAIRVTMDAMTHCSPAYPPLVELLADSAPEQECPF